VWHHQMLCDGSHGHRECEVRVGFRARLPASPPASASSPAWSTELIVRRLSGPVDVGFRPHDQHVARRADRPGSGRASRGVNGAIVSAWSPRPVPEPQPCGFV